MAWMRSNARCMFHAGRRRKLWFPLRQVAEEDERFDDLLGIPGIAALPAVKWRQLNLDKLSAEKRAALVANLERVLTGEGLR